MNLRKEAKVKTMKTKGLDKLSKGGTSNPLDDENDSN